jgi:transposase
VKQEGLSWLATNPFYTKRFAFFVGRRCRVATIKDVAKETHLDWRTIKSLEMQYMREQVRRVGTPAPRAIGIDEISIRKGHTYRIVVSDLDRRRARSGLAARIARKPAWTNSSPGSVQRSAGACTWR